MPSVLLGAKMPNALLGANTLDYELASKNFISAGIELYVASITLVQMGIIENKVLPEEISTILRWLLIFDQFHLFNFGRLIPHFGVLYGCRITPS